MPDALDQRGLKAESAAFLLAELTRDATMGTQARHQPLGLNQSNGVGDFESLEPRIEDANRL